MSGWRSAQGTAGEDIRSDWESKFVTTDNSGKLLIVTGDDPVDYSQLSLSMVDAEFVAQRQLSTQEICRIFRIPPHLVGAPVAHSLTYNNAEMEALDFLKFSLGPVLRLIEQVITADTDLSPATVFVEFLLDDLLRADSLSKATYYGQAIASGWMTIEEVRQRENLPTEPRGQTVTPQPQPTEPAPPGITPPAPYDPGVTANA